MSGDEVLVLFFSLAVTAMGCLRWNWSLALVSPLMCGWGYRGVLFLLPFACAVLLFAVLRGLAADDVRNDGRYLVMYEALGTAWILGSALLLPAIGYSARDD